MAGTASKNNFFFCLQHTCARALARPISRGRHLEMSCDRADVPPASTLSLCESRCGGRLPTRWPGYWNLALTQCRGRRRCFIFCRGGQRLIRARSNESACDSSNVWMQPSFWPATGLNPISAPSNRETFAVGWLVD